jgi:hypothetical protein
MNNMKSSLHISVWLFFLSLFSMTGCPRIAKIELYNNTSVVLIFISGEQTVKIEPKQTRQLQFGRQSFHVESSLGRWHYSRTIPHNGENGPFFDGTLRLQINEDGIVFALQKNIRAPQVDFLLQPHGYPLSPRGNRRG